MSTFDAATHDGTGPPDDAALLRAVAALWDRLDPPPGDLADGVLARIAAEDLEFDLLTLVDSSESLAGVRHGGAEEDAGAWSLEYDGPDFHVYVRLSRIEQHTRLDGWVVPAGEIAVELRGEQSSEPLRTTADEFGRFELADVPAGVNRLAFLPPDDSTRPQITPPFWI